MIISTCHRWNGGGYSWKPSVAVGIQCSIAPALHLVPGAMPGLKGPAWLKKWPALPSSRMELRDSPTYYSNSYDSCLTAWIQAHTCRFKAGRGYWGQFIELAILEIFLKSMINLQIKEQLNKLGVLEYRRTVYDMLNKLGQLMNTLLCSPSRTAKCGIGVLVKSVEL